ncbi:MAG: hypothetical protein JWL86_6965 [Rhizobium sp.]|nr:hypothetical protein [Rhizobium sp.]
MSKHKIELTDKELYLTWAIVCWFTKPVTSTLKHKLSGMAFSPDRKKYEHFDEYIEDRIIETGKWLEKRRVQV